MIDENIDGVETTGTLRDWVNKNPVSYGHLLDGGGDWIVRDDAWCWVRQGATPNPDGDTFSTGDLTVGFGAGTNGGPTSGRFGPEFGFGIEMADYFDEPVVLVKTAWGGASLFGDFRPPSAVAKRGGSVGFFYQRMMSAWQDALAAIASRYPGREIELAGFGWHQGYNDRLNASSAAEYEANIADLIIDIRADLNAPALPVVIATTSMGGYPNEPYDAGETRWLQVQDALLAMEPRENVTTVLTAPLYRDASESPRNQDYHWNQNGETLYRIGEQMGQAMVAMLATPEVPDTTPPSPDPLGFATPPTALNSATITMTATTATDDNHGVEYHFEETTGNPGGSDSGWQDSPTFTDTGLEPSTTYSYRVKARDTSSNNNETGWSPVESATTEDPPAVEPGVIFWGTPTLIVGPEDVSTNGSPTYSASGDPGVAATVNGVAFTAATVPGFTNDASIGTRAPATGDAAYDTMLRAYSWSGGAVTVTIPGLTVGANYEVQIFYGDTVQSPFGKRSMVIDLGKINEVQLIAENGAEGGPGMHVTGTFIADSTTQSFTVNGFDYCNNIGGTQTARPSGLNGIQVRETAAATDDYTTWAAIYAPADLIGWTEDTGAVQNPGTTAADGVQTVAVTLSPDLPATPKRFVRLKASEPEN